MMTQDPYLVRAVEYLTCLGFLVVFSLFWRYLNTEPPVFARAAARLGQFADFFRMPERVYFHPGHAWARLEAPGVMAVGVDDFAQHLVGEIGHVVLPKVGQELKAGERAWALRADGKAVDVLAPITGKVIAVNEAAADRAALVNEDPYGRGWLLKVQVPKTASAVRALMTGEAARKWIDGVTEELMHTMTPRLGQVYADGGLPVHGIAKAIDEARWDEIARKFLLS